MTQDPRWTMDAEEADAVQNVVDRVASWQDGANPGMVRAEFDRVAGEVGITVPDDLATELCHHIEHADERPEVRDWVLIT